MSNLHIIYKIYKDGSEKHYNGNKILFIYNRPKKQNETKRNT